MKKIRQQTSRNSSQKICALQADEIEYRMICTKPEPEFLEQDLLEEQLPRTYGIAVFYRSSCLRQIGDITTEEAKLKSLIEKLNRGGLAPCQLDDIVADFLTEG